MGLDEGATPGSERAGNSGGPEGAPVLELQGFGFAFGDRTIKRSLDLQIPARGPFTLLGPVAAGKSSLLRLLAGEIGPAARCQSWGVALYRGAPLGERGRPALAGQRARLMIGPLFDMLADKIEGRERRTRAEQRDAVRGALSRLDLADLEAHLDRPVLDLATAQQRCVAIAGAFLTGADLICADEPTAGLGEGDRARVVALLARIAAERAVLLVTHHQGDLRLLGGRVALMAGGVVLEEARAEDFLAEPSTEIGRHFLRTGSCSVPSPDSVLEELEPIVAETVAPPLPPPPSSVRPGATGPFTGAFAASIRWVLPGRLAGIPRPGLLRDLEDDLHALRDVGIQRIVCLEETATVPGSALARFGIEPEHLPIQDMRAPSFAAVRALCTRMEEWLSVGQKVAVHCRGGLGRTGTVLAAFFIQRGATAPEALSAVRRVEPRFVQSSEQIDFLRALAADARGPSAGAPPKGAAPPTE